MVALAARVPLMTSLLVLGLVGCNYFHPGYPLFAKDGYQERNAYHFPFLRVFPLRFLSILFSNPFHTSLSFAASNRSAKLVHGKRLKIEVMKLLLLCTIYDKIYVFRVFSVHYFIFWFLGIQGCFWVSHTGWCGIVRGLSVCVSMRRAGSNGPRHCSKG
jgi:hypothetical protein